MPHGQTDAAALEAEVQQEFERREKLLKKHEAEAREAVAKFEPTTFLSALQEHRVRWHPHDIRTQEPAETALASIRSFASDPRDQISISPRGPDCTHTYA